MPSTHIDPGASPRELDSLLVEAARTMMQSPEEQARVISTMLEQLEPRLFAHRARAFNRVDFRGTTGEEIRAAFNHVLFFDRPSPNGVNLVRPTLSVALPQKWSLWRARGLKPLDTEPLEGQVETEVGVWEAPPEFVSTARFNLENQPRLYMSAGSPLAPLAEIRAEVGSVALLSKFSMRSSINLQRIDFELDPNLHSSRARYNWRMIYRFFRQQLTREVSETSLTTYEVTSLLTEEYFNLPPGFSDGIGYESTLAPSHLNTAIYPQEGHEKLTWEGSVAVRVLSTYPRTRVWPISFTLPRTQPTDPLRWMSCEDARWVHIFPELIPLMNF